MNTTSSYFRAVSEVGRLLGGFPVRPTCKRVGKRNIMKRWVSAIKTEEDLPNCWQEPIHRWNKPNCQISRCVHTLVACASEAMTNTDTPEKTGINRILLPSLSVWKCKIRVMRNVATRGPSAHKLDLFPLFTPTLIHSSNSLTYIHGDYLFVQMYKNLHTNPPLDQYRHIFILFYVLLLHMVNRKM